MYEAFLLVVNEFGEIIAFYFLFGKSNTELKPLFEALKARYVKLGFPLPLIW